MDNLYLKLFTCAVENMVEFLTTEIAELAALFELKS